jgi:hypothetical protein
MSTEPRGFKISRQCLALAALMLAINQFRLAFSLKIGRLSSMTFSFYTYAWRFTYRNNRMRVAIV